MDLESDEEESLWTELQWPVRSVFIGFIYRKPKDVVTWEDHFCDMIDNMESLNKECLLLRDFNINLMFPKHWWNSISSFNLQLIKYHTKITVNTYTL